MLDVRARVCREPGLHLVRRDTENVPRVLMEAAARGLREGFEGAGWQPPECGLLVEVFDGREHAVDSRELSFRLAGHQAAHYVLSEWGLIDELRLHASTRIVDLLDEQE